MAKRTKDEKQVLNTDSSSTRQGSLFKTAVVGAPIAIGAGVGISSLSKKSSHFGQAISELPHQHAANAIYQFRNRYVSKPHSGVFKDWQLDKLAGFSKNIAVSHEDIRTSWMRAARHLDPTGTIFGQSQQRLANAATSEQMLNDIRFMTERNSSVYMNQVVGGFLDDLQLLQNRAKSGLKTSTSMLASPKNIKAASISADLVDPITRDYLFKMSSKLGADVGFKRIQHPGSEGSALLATFSKGGEKLSLRISEPLASDPNILYSGQFQQSRRIAGKYGIINAQGVLQQSFKHDQWVANRAYSELLPQLMKEKRLNSSMSRKLVNEFQLSTIQDLEWVPSVENEATRKYIDLRKDVLRLYTPTGPGTSKLRQINEYEYYEAIKGGLTTSGGEKFNVYPSGSPTTIGHGVVSTKDVRNVSSLFPEAVPYGRRPIQPARFEFTPSSSAIQRMNLSPLEQDYSWLRKEGLVRTPITSTAYVSSALDPELFEYGITSEGQGLISRTLQDKREVVRSRHFDIAMNEGMDLSGLLGEEASAGVYNINRTLKKGSILGYDPSGKAIQLESDTLLSQAISYSGTKDKGDYIRVFGEETIKDIPQGKFFGVKGMMKTEDQSIINRIMSKISPSGNLGRLQEAQAIVTMDDLRKNRGLHYDQMFSALWEFSKVNMQGGHQVQSFNTDPVSYISKLRKQASLADKFQHEIILKNAYELSREAKLTPGQMGAVFGAVPEVFGSEYTKLMPGLASAEQQAIERGVARGFGQLWFAGLGGPGSGRVGTIEPRMLEMLHTPYLEGVGSNISNEILQRVEAAGARQLSEHSILTQALQSTLKSVDQPTTSAQKLLDSMDLGFPQERSYLKTPKGNIMIPGINEVRGMQEYLTPSGASVVSDLSYAYRNLIETTAGIETGANNIADLESSISNLQSDLGAARTAAIAGKGGLLRGRLPGSRFLTGMIGKGLGSNEARITEKYARQMIEDMKGLGIYEESELDNMMQRLMRGKSVSGIVMRHPAIGPYNVQPINYVMGTGDQATIEFGSQFFKGKITDRLGNTVELSNPVRLSPLIGLGGDVDADIYSAMLASPQLDKNLSTFMATQESKDLYDAFAIRSQLMKAKAPEGTISLQEAMAGDALKLGVTQKRLGRISNTLNIAKAAVIEGGLSSQDKMSSLWLLNWLEQTPISAKHIEQGRELQMVSLLDDINESIMSFNSKKIESSVRSVLEHAKVEGMAAAEAGFRINLEDVTTGATRELNVPGTDLSKTSANIANAMSYYKASSAGGMTSDVIRKISFGKQKPTAKQAIAMLRPEVMERSPIGSLFSSPLKQGSLSKFSQSVLGHYNRMAAAGKSLIPHAKPLALGTGAALGLAAFLSDPMDALSPGAKRSPQPILSSGTGGMKIDQQLNIHPDTQVQGNPTAPDLIRTQNSARVASSNTNNSQINIRASSSQSMNYTDINRQIKNLLNNNADIRTQIRDQRSSINEQSINKLLNNN